ncbi:MAG: DUF4340 domain-containing protein [Candidatus Aureabacteria bacterium]|nr:DUF4340 domain-containing protein [Candidatus Auribacterota bacterium]
MKMRNLIAAGVIFAAVLAYILFLEPRIKTTDQKELRKDKVFDLPFPGHFEKIICQNVALEKKEPESPWKIVHPFVFPADETEVSVLEDSIRDLSFERKFSTGELEKEKKGEMGLDHIPEKSLLTFVYRSYDGEETQTLLAFGNDTPVGNSCYVKVIEDDSIYIINKEIKRLFESLPEEFSRKMIFEGASLNSCKSLLLKKEKREVFFERKSDKDHLLIKRPHKVFIHAPAVKKLISHLGSFSLDTFYGKDKDFQEAGRIIWDNGEEATELAYAWDEKSGSAAARLKDYDVTFSLSSEAVKQLEDVFDTQQFYSPSITPFNNADVRSIELKIYEKTVLLKNNEKRWNYDEKGTSFPCPYKAETLAKNLLLMKIMEYKEKKDLDTEVREYARLACSLFEGADSEYVIDIGIGKNGELYATLDHELYGVLADVDVMFISSLSKGQAIPEKEDAPQ